MPYETMTYPEFNTRMGDESVLHVLPLYTMHGRGAAGHTQVTAYLPAADSFPWRAVSALEQRLRETWQQVEIILVTDVPATQIWWEVPT